MPRSFRTIPKRKENPQRIGAEGDPMPSARKNQTHQPKAKKIKRNKRMFSNQRRKAPPLPAVRRKGSGVKNRGNLEDWNNLKLKEHPNIEGPQALIARSAKRTKKTKHAVGAPPSAQRAGDKKGTPRKTKDNPKQEIQKAQTPQIGKPPTLELIFLI